MPEIRKVYAVERHTITRDNLRPMRAPKPKSWSHEDDLQAHKGKRISVAFNDETNAEYILLEADRFALKLAYSNAEGGQSIATVYKHAISAYSFPKE